MYNNRGLHILQICFQFLRIVSIKIIKGMVRCKAGDTIFKYMELVRQRALALHRD